MDNDLDADAVSALEASGVSVSLAVLEGDAPLIYVNAAFERMTHYRRADVIGKNCRFLQGVGTNRDAVAKLREAVSDSRAESICLLNFRADGTPFHNLVILAPIFSPSRNRTIMLGCQYDLSTMVEALDVEPHIDRIGGLVNQLHPNVPDAWNHSLEASHLTAQNISLRVRNYLRRATLAKG